MAKSRDLIYSDIKYLKKGIPVINEKQKDHTVREQSQNPIGNS